MIRDNPPALVEGNGIYNTCTNTGDNYNDGVIHRNNTNVRRELEDFASKLIGIFELASS